MTHPRIAPTSRGMWHTRDASAMFTSMSSPYEERIEVRVIGVRVGEGRGCRHRNIPRVTHGKLMESRGKDIDSMGNDLTRFIQHRRCIGPHTDAKSVYLELMLQPLPRLIPFLEGPCSLYLSSLSVVFQVFSWNLWLPTSGGFRLGPGGHSPPPKFLISSVVHCFY